MEQSNIALNGPYVARRMEFRKHPGCETWSRWVEYFVTTRCELHLSALVALRPITATFVPDSLALGDGRSIRHSRKQHRQVT